MRNHTMVIGIALLCAAQVVRADHGNGDHGKGDHGKGDHDKAVSYRATTIDYPGFRGTTTVNGISDSDGDSERIVGAFSVPATQFAYGFMEFRGGFSLLPTAPCESAHCDTTPLAVNSRGDVAGEFSQDVAHRSVFVIHGRVLQLLQIPGSRDLALLGGLNERGDIVGFFQTNSGVIRTFLYSGSMLRELAVPAGVVDMAGRAINNSGQITGSFDDAKGLHGFVDTHGLFTHDVFTRFDFPSGIDTSPVAINDAGDIVGSYSVAAAANQVVQHGFLLSRGRFTRLDFPGGLGTAPSALNDSDTVVGTYENPALRAPFNVNAFVFQRGQYIRLPLPGAVESVSGVSASGVVVGTYFDPGCPTACSVHGFRASPNQDHQD